MEDRKFLIKEKEMLNKIRNRTSEIIKEWNERNNTSNK